jgi:hypothetical protein
MPNKRTVRFSDRADAGEVKFGGIEYSSRHKTGASDEGRLGEDWLKHTHEFKNLRKLGHGVFLLQGAISMPNSRVICLFIPNKPAKIFKRPRIMSKMLFNSHRPVRIKYGKMLCKNILEFLFSLKNSRDRKCKILTICGWKINFRRKIKPSILSIKNAGAPVRDALFRIIIDDIPEKSILMIEPNNCHGEVMPGYAKYLLELGYNIDMVMIDELGVLNPMCRYEDARIRKIIMPFELLYCLLNAKQRMERYEKLFFTSHIIYRWLGNDEFPSIFQYFASLENYRDKIVVVEHHLDKTDPWLLEHGAVINLADFGLGMPVNPHYFGKIVKTSKNADTTNFIMVGAIESERRNCDLLIDAVEDLHLSGIVNFKVTVIGRGRLNQIHAEFRNYFDIRGVLDFPGMYKAMEKADFFLTLLDPENPEHERYLSTGTSGSFQLIYGFRKPCLIADKFAAKHGYTHKNSIIYANNADLAGAMDRGIRMSNREYTVFQSELEELAGNVYEKSLRNMRRLFNVKDKRCG